MEVGSSLSVAGIAALMAAGYHAVAPRSQCYGRLFIGAPAMNRTLALTYDDGPNDPDTLLLLEVLARHGVPATFFLIGKYIAKRPAIVRKIAEAGHAIGNHTYSHPNLLFCSEAEVRRELDDWAKAIEEAGVPLNGPYCLFRPPFGMRRPATLRIARELGYCPVSWTVTCFDWKETTADRVEGHAVRQIRGGDVILLHDGGHKRMGANRRHTIEATDKLIGRYKKEGYGFVTVTAWIEQIKRTVYPTLVIR
jgi:peptidoglycan-N-acetylglucosamine deacetylase